MAHSANDAAPARKWLTVTPSNTVNLPAGCRSLLVGGAGTLTLVGDDNVAIQFTTVDANTILPLAPKRVNATGTSATGIVALY